MSSSLLVIEQHYNAQMLQLLRQRTAGQINFHVTLQLIRKEDVQMFKKAVGMEWLKLTEKYFSEYSQKQFFNF